ncbi:pseudouridine synthase [Roridomyces roridus]|uniref:tRNA pseudouridine synthase n=1 Tax=Roridomyces roridus TaxID=1738132 RepID=A0AAD7FTZ9_9AGAR|nr:pseudouridine synthase [Roridomyces roridus]
MITPLRHLTNYFRAMAASTPYESWSKEDLIARLMHLELELKESRQPPHSRSFLRASHPDRDFDFSSYSRRKIALKFLYAGWAYNGLAIQASDATPLPTVEGVLFEALGKARLIDPSAGFEGCGWERCGRTDRGVSAGGQVISLWVRSALAPKPVAIPDPPNPSSSEDPPGTWPEDDFGSLDFPSPAHRPTGEAEHNYVGILNRMLPPTIRILAWSPVAPDFSSRFACTSRHYKYFFAADGLDIPRMTEAASLLVGGHDFRNLCKIDPAKQLTMYRRRVISADINPVEAGMYVLDLEGWAFLYHQVRHIMAVLFLVGSGLESPSIVTALLNVEPGAEGLSVVDTKPVYQMADALPLMLYDCHYSPGDVDWQTGDADPDALTGASLYHQIHSIHARSAMYATLNRQFLAAAAVHHAAPTPLLPLESTGFVPDGKTPMNIPLGGGEFRRTAKYIPLLERRRGDHYEVANERWRLGPGVRRKKDAS